MKNLKNSVVTFALALLMATSAFGKNAQIFEGQEAILEQEEKLEAEGFGEDNCKEIDNKTESNEGGWLTSESRSVSCTNKAGRSILKKYEYRMSCPDSPPYISLSVEQLK